MKIEIKSMFGGVLFEFDGDSLKDAVVAAVKKCANLYGANLSGANLYGANLSGADLSGADLSGANLSGADLYGANLSGANLYGANLSGANLSRANLSGANLSRADLSRADLSRANLSGANLSRADLSGANLSGANLYGANLSRANLSRADLSGANLYGANLSRAKDINCPINCPESGEFTAFKKCRDKRIVTLLIPADAKRSSATSRKCRASKAVCIRIENSDGEHQTATSSHDPSFTYRVGETVEVDDFCESRWDECAAGIHFFITRREAEEY